MQMKKRILSGICAAAVLVCACFPALAENMSPSQELIERMVVSYAAYGERDAQAMEELSAADPAAAEKWERIMDLWEAPVTVNAEIPERLPNDDTLCLVALGFQLNPDGTMREELIERLNVLLAASGKYPQAVIVCTGGGTAADDPSATEAGRMAEWLCAQGVDPSRIYVEDKSITTAQNAIFTFDILAERCPQVAEIAIVSSDYHIATGTLLFGAEAILRNSDIRVTGNAAWHAPSGALSAMFQAGALIELSGDVETAFEIYYETYDIHELPPLHNADDSRTEEGRSDMESIYQVALLQSLAQGHFDGVITAGELKAHGDTGIGTFDGLNGEMIVLDGVVYQAIGDGSVVIPPDSETIPFCNVTFFEPDISLPLSDIADMAALQERLSAVVKENGANLFYMVRITGAFSAMKVRSEYRQEKPYRELDVALAADQLEYDYENVRGTMIGLYCPPFMSGLNSVGWHFHFITEDLARGGHVLQVGIDSAVASLDRTSGFVLALPEDDAAFQSMDLSRDMDEAIHRAETAASSDAKESGQEGK